MFGALDLLRRIGWAIVSFIYDLIDSLFNILRELNLYDIVDSVAQNTIFSKFHSGIIAIAITLLAFFIVWRFVIKILEPDEGLTIHQIILEIFKCGTLVLMSVFLFAEANNFSAKLSGYTSSMFNENKNTISDSMLNMYITFDDGYKESDEFKNENIKENIENDTFSEKRMFNDKYITSKNWILPDEKEYKYNIDWIMAILVGGFFLFALFFSGIMLARRQMEFLFLFLISPIVFATSIGNKQRRGAVIEQLISLILQGAVIMLIIGLTVIVMNAIDRTVFFPNSNIQNAILKSLMFLGCAIFLLTGSQAVNRFIGANVSVNSGREQFMSLMSYGSVANTVANVGGLATTGASAFGLGVLSSTIGKLGGNNLVNRIGGSIQNFGSRVNGGGNVSNYMQRGIGNTIERFGSSVKRKTPSNIGRNMRDYGKSNMSGAISSIMPQRNMYRGRYSGRER